MDVLGAAVEYQHPAVHIHHAELRSVLPEKALEEIVTQHAQYVVCLNKSVMCSGRTVETLTAENLRLLYQQDVGLYAHAGTHEGHSHAHGEHGGGSAQ